MNDLSQKLRKTRIVCGTLINLTLALALAGCFYHDAPAPAIVGYQRTTVRPVLQTRAPSPPPRPYRPDVPAEWIVPADRKWTAIIIHHSATTRGNAALFDKQHREQNHWDGIGYDFVIGNGTGSRDGQVEVTFRWTQQRAGAHVGGTPNNWANEEGIGICLVGDFNRTTPSWSQMQSLTKLVTFLQRRYAIPTSRIYGHGTTPGAQKTDCPGRKFPLARFKASLPTS